jgi:predicted protein tyrosine phosphatase
MNWIDFFSILSVGSAGFFLYLQYRSYQKHQWHKILFAPRLYEQQENKKVEILVYSRAAIERVAPQEVPHIIISITSRADDVPKIPTNPLCLGTLGLTFADADVAVGQTTESQLFTALQAGEIWSFVRKHLHYIQRIVIHCDGGISRSSGVAGALSKALFGNDEEFFSGRFKPNMRVYRKLLDAYYQETNSLTDPFENPEARY